MVKMNINIYKYNAGAIGIRTFGRDVKNKILYRDYFETTLSLKFVEGNNSMYVLFVALLCGKVTANDVKNNMYFFRKRLLINAKQRTTKTI